MFEIVSGLMVRANNPWDHYMVLGVIENNRYRLPSAFHSSDIILDIGAHVGSFSYACLDRSAGKVYAFEPDRENIRICAANLKSFRNKAVLHRGAVWRSDTPESQLPFTGPSQTPIGLNYGGGNVVFNDGLGILVRSQQLDSILSNMRRVRLMKLDCESSEWPILFTCRLLECIDEIVGEYHEIGGRYSRAMIPQSAQLPGYTSYTIGDLTAYLERHNFLVEVVEGDCSNIGMFFARRR